MSKIKWSASMFFYSADEKIKIENMSVLSFQVRGGATRTVHLNSAKDMEIAFELDDARDHKNIQVFIPPTEGIAVAQLSEAFLYKKTLDAIFAIESKIGKTWLRTFHLSSTGTVILRHPVTVQRNEERALKIEMALPNAALNEQSPHGKGSIVKEL